MENGKVIALSGGGTAGHILPSIALIGELNKNFEKIIYIGSRAGMEVKICKEHNIPLFCVSTVKFSRKKIIQNFKIPFVLRRGVSEAKKILREQKVDVVFSKGGYVALPAVLAAYKLKIPVIIHESDATIGLANKITQKKAARLITSFSTTPTGSNGIFLGNPIRSNIFEGNSEIVKKRFNIENSLPVLLIFGGSLGSVTINNCVLSALETLTKNYNVIHISGKNKINSAAVNTDSKIKTANYHTVEYAQDIQNYLAAADYVISRAGASAALEIMALQKKVIFIPLQKASRGDQVDNANYYGKYNGVRVLSEKDLSAEKLLSELEHLKKCEKNNFVFDKNTNKKIVAEIVRAENKSK